MARYGQHVSLLNTPQTEQADVRQVQNQAGGYSFKVDCWQRLDRFLILGTEGGTYYANERKATKQAFTALRECLAENGVKAVTRIVELSLSGRAPKNSPAIAALAFSTTNVATPEARQSAIEAIPKVCRTGTHLFEFVRTVKEFRGFGRALKRGIGNWYLGKEADRLAYQLVKYQQREGWSHRDVLRTAHVTTESPEQQACLRWAVNGIDGMSHKAIERREGGKAEYESIDTEQHLPDVIEAFERAKGERDPKKIARLISDHNLTHEMIPNEVKSSPIVWSALLECMPMTAMIRNLGKMTAIGLLQPFSEEVKLVTARLANSEAIKRARIHPLAALVALNTYKAGKGVRGKLTWEPIAKVIDALDDLFYAAFESIEPTGKNTLLAIDVSGSMDWGGDIPALSGITPRIGAAAMAMVTARSEPNCEFLAFSDTLVPLNMSRKMRLDDVVTMFKSIRMGGTDCSLPMIWAINQKVQVDCFQVYTDCETWHGDIHPHQALTNYRNVMQRPDAKLVVVGMTSNDFSIAKPDDPGMVDVVGFDTAAPRLIADFARGIF